jgi:hypothetical protein
MVLGGIAVAGCAAGITVVLIDRWCGPHRSARCTAPRRRPIPEVIGLWPQDADPRFIVQAVAAKALVAKPGARPGESAEHDADVLYGVLSPELYLVYVRDRGRTPRQWEDWTYDVLRTQLCAD